MSAGVSETDGRSDRSGKREVAHGHASWRWTSLNVSEVVNGLTDCVFRRWDGRSVEDDGATPVNSTRIGILDSQTGQAGYE